MKILILIVVLIGLFASNINGQINCVQTPSDPSCANYQYPNANSTADIAALCKSMPYMPVCTINDKCMSLHSHDGLCDPFSILGDSCTHDMPGMGGCKNFRSLCNTTAGSVVQECKNFQQIDNLPTTMTLVSLIQSICDEMPMSACTSCKTSKPIDCDLLTTYTSLCMEMPTMSQCQAFNTMCADDSNLVSSQLSTFCKLPVEEQTPLMRMFFHTGFLEYVLFENWIPRTARQFAGYWFLVFFFAIIFECEKTLRSILEKRWEIKPDSDDAVQSSFLKGHYAPFSYRDVVRGFLHGLELTMSYLLMLVAMTFNVGLFFSVIAGTIIGNIFVGRFRTYKPKVTCCD